MLRKGEDWKKAVSFWKKLPSDPNSKYDKEVKIKASSIQPQVTWGTSPQDVAPINGYVPDPKNTKDVNRKKGNFKIIGLHGTQTKSKNT